MHEDRRENREREMPWTALVDSRRGGSQVRSVGACVPEGGCATGPSAAPSGRTRGLLRVQGRASATPAGFCRGREPGVEQGDMVARWPCRTQCPNAARGEPRRIVHLEFFVASGPANRWERGGEAAVLWFRISATGGSSVRAAVATTIRSVPTVLHHLCEPLAANPDLGLGSSTPMIAPDAPA